MLKLEKIARTRDINVCLRDKPTALNRTFFVALGYALALHVAAFVLVHISVCKMGYAESSFIPAFVATDWQDAVQIQGLQLEEEIPFFFRPPLAQTPMPLSKADVQLLEADFHSIDDAFYREFFSGDSPLSAPVQITVSGALADSFLAERDTYEQELTQLVLEKKIADLSPKRFRFQVQAEDATGQVFFWQSIDPPSDALCYEYAEAIIKSLRFNSLPPMQKGQIDIAFHLSLLNWQPTAQR